MKSLEKITVRELIDNIENYPEISIIRSTDQKIPDFVLDKTLECLGKYCRRDKCNVSIIIRGNNTSAKNLLANSSRKLRFKPNTQ